MLLSLPEFNLCAKYLLKQNLFSSPGLSAGTVLPKEG